MKEIKGNVFDLAFEDGVDSICITTNGVVNHSGQAMMGAGTAGEAARRWPDVRANLGRALRVHGNLPYVIGLIDKAGEFQNPTAKMIKEKEFACLVWSFPTKEDFRNNSIPKLIERSAVAMAQYADKFDLKKVIIPLPGCGRGTGKLNWKTDVKPLLEPVLDDRFYISYLDTDKID